MDKEAFERYVHEYTTDVYRVAIANCENAQDAEDVTQNTFVKLFVSNCEWVDDEHVKRWLIRVAVNESLTLLRSPWKKHRATVTLDEVYGEKEPSFTIKERSDLFYTVRELPPKYRAVVHLYYYVEYSVREIAEILSISETAVQTRLQRARNLLRKKLEPNADISKK